MRYDRKKDIPPKYLLLVFTVICIVFLFLSYAAKDHVAALKLYTSKAIAPFQKGVNEIGLWTDSKMKNIKKIEELNEENRALREENARLKEEATIYQNRMIELSTLQALYDLDEVYPDYEKTVAHVFAKDSTSWFSEFYIDKGTDDGLFTGANVMYGEGLCGLVIECFDDYSKVRAIIDDKSDISAKILPSSALCTVEGNLNQYKHGTLVLHNIDRDAAVSVGDKVVTSDISDRYHPGVLIGYIKNMEYDTNNLTMTAYITPACNFDNITDVLVITDKKKSITED